MQARWFLRGFLAFLCLSGCAGNARHDTPSPVSHLLTPDVAIPAGCSPLVQYQSTDFRGVTCIALFCRDGRIVRTSGCTTASNPPDYLTEQQLAQLRQRIDKSNFFGQEAYYPASTDC
jgi:hypothetical protein